MIVLNLLCDNGHHFEGWFASSEAFRHQGAQGLVHCPQCQTVAVSQLPSAPRVLRHGQGAGAVSAQSDGPEVRQDESHAATELADALPAPLASVVQGLQQALATMARQAENVGQRFAEEARRIHYDEVPKRAIRGVATLAEARDLLDEGIAVLPAPRPADEDLH